MPRFALNPEAVQALSAYLMTFRDPAIDSLPEPQGDHDTGNSIYRESQCIVCHVTKEDTQGNPIGGVVGPDLRKIGNKVNERWLDEYRGWVYGLGYGAQLGVGVTTVVSSAGTYVAMAAAFLVERPVAGAVIVSGRFTWA